MRRRMLAAWAAATISLAGFGATAARAADQLRLAIGQRGNWDSAVPELGQGAGIFQRHGLELNLLYTQGGGETIQAVIPGSADIGIAAGTLGVIGAFAKGAPVRIIAPQMTGAADFWYARADSGIQGLKDMAGKTIAYSTNGSSTNIMVLEFVRTSGVPMKPVATGGTGATFTAVMSGQIDVGWSSPPFGLDALEEGKIRIVARGSDIESIRNQSPRTVIANASFLRDKPEVAERFVQAYRETIDWMYASDDALKAYAAFAGTTLDRARRIRDEFFPKPTLQAVEIKGLPAIMEDAVTYKYVGAPLTAEQTRELIRIPAPKS